MRKIVHVRMWLKKQRKKCDESKNAANNKRFLISVKVVGSAGPLRFIVSESESVKRVINSALKLYARQGRLPVLTSAANSFLLFPADAELSALEPSMLIGSPGVRNFLLCKTASPSLKTEVAPPQKSMGNWKTWINKILYHHHRCNKCITS